MDANERARLRGLANYGGNDFCEAASPAAAIALLDRVTTLESLLAECHSHLKYHHEENGEMRFDDGTIIDRVAAAIGEGER